MKNTFVLSTLLAALLFPHAPAASPSVLHESGPFRIAPTSASEPLMFYGDHVFFARTVEWRGSTLYVDSCPVEAECPRVSLAQEYSFSAEAFQPKIHFLYIRPFTKNEILLDQRRDGKFNFNIGYQF